VRILFVSGEYPAMQGGVGDYTQRLSRALGALGADVHVLTSVDAGPDHLRLPTDPHEPAVHLELDAPGWALWGSVTSMVHRIRPDIVHIQYQSAAYALHPAVNLLPARLRAAGKSPRIATTFHDLRYPYLFPKAGPLRWRSVTALASGSDACVLTNPADWSRLAGTRLAPKLVPIVIGSNIQCEPPPGYDRAACRAQWGAGPDDWLLGYFGFLNVGKGGETLMRALAELVQAGHPARLLMVGGQIGSSDPTNRAYLERVEALIRELGLTDRVQWTGFMPNDQVSANLLAADCAVLPYREGATLRHGSLMAALAHGLPIVSTEAENASPDLDGIFPAVIGGQNALLSAPEDHVAIARAVTRVMTDDELRARLRRASLDLASHFEWDAIARKHLELYERLKERH
jgi:glycosyltransferase involved in cell wall biosynthesis